MSEVTRIGEFEVSAGDLWELVADFGGLDKYMEGVPALEVEGEGVGATRTIPGGQVPTIERLDVFEPDQMTLTYSIVQGELPFRDYSAQMTVESVDDASSRLTWTGTFEADGVPSDKAERFAAAIYNAGIEGFRRHLAGS